jgi:hypothetical protein
VQHGREKNEGALSSEELECNAQDGDTTFSQEEAAGHSVPESERDPTDDEDRPAGPEPFSGTILPPD